MLANINVSQPKGNFDGPELDYTINDNDQIQDPKDYLGTVIAYQNGAPVFLRDTARVSQAAQNLEQAQNRVETDVAALKNAELVYRSNEQLAGQGYVAQTTLEQSRAAYIAAEQELHNARQGLAPAQAALQTARTNVQQTQVDRATIEQNSAALDQARANVQLLQTQIAQSSIYAPFDGVVTARLLDPGAFAGPSQPIVQVAEIDHVYVNANVPDEDLGYVRPGTAATFTRQNASRNDLRCQRRADHGHAFVSRAPSASQSGLRVARGHASHRHRAERSAP